MTIRELSRYLLSVVVAYSFCLASARLIPGTLLAQSGIATAEDVKRATTEERSRFLGAIASEKITVTPDRDAAEAGREASDAARQSRPGSDHQPNLLPHPDNLGELFAGLHIDATRLPGIPLGRKITSYEFEDAADLFAVAFYFVEPGNPQLLSKSLEVLLLDKTIGRWARRTIDIEHLPDQVTKSAYVPRPGSIVGIRHTRHWLLIDTHVSPSAGSLLVLTRALEPKALLYGWTLFTLPNESIVYHGSLVHFAPTHSVEIRMYDPASGKARTIYPNKPYDLPRLAFIKQMKAAYDRFGQDWCRLHNHHCDAELFDSRWGGLWAVDQQTGAMAFTVRFGNGRVEGMPESPDYVVPQQEVVVACRDILAVDRVSCRETPLLSLRAAHPDLVDYDLLGIAARQLSPGADRRR